VLPPGLSVGWLTDNEDDFVCREAVMRLARGRRSVARTSMGTFGGKRTGGSSPKRGGSGLSGFKTTRNTPRPSWGGRRKSR